MAVQITETTEHAKQLGKCVFLYVFLLFSSIQSSPDPLKHLQVWRLGDPLPEHKNQSDGTEPARGQRPAESAGSGRPGGTGDGGAPVPSLLRGSVLVFTGQVLMLNWSLGGAGSLTVIFMQMFLYIFIFFFFPVWTEGYFISTFNSFLYRNSINK